MPSSARRTYYMHTLDGKPAQFVEAGPDVFGRDHSYIAFAGGRRSAPLATSLRQIRREQQRAIRNARADASPNFREWGDAKRYGYVRVATPEGES